MRKKGVGTGTSRQLPHSRLRHRSRVRTSPTPASPTPSTLRSHLSIDGPTRSSQWPTSFASHTIGEPKLGERLHGEFGGSRCDERNPLSTPRAKASMDVS